MKKLLGLFCGTLVVLLVARSASAENAKVTQLRDKLAESIDVDGNASPAMKSFIKERLLPLSTDVVFVQEVKAQNDKGVSLDKIKEIDRQWQEAEEELPIQTEMTTNACAKEIGKQLAQEKVIREAFVMDNQGANVGQSDITSDYWQGDEPKWQNSYNDGKGGVDIGKNKFDRSANAEIQQISLPIIDEDGNVVGAVSYGIAVDQL